MKPLPPCDHEECPPTHCAKADTFLHIDGVSKRDKAGWVRAARSLHKRGVLPDSHLATFVIDTLNRRAQQVNDS